MFIYYEVYISKEDAYMREQKLKRYGNGLQELKKRLNKSFEGGAG